MFKERMVWIVALLLVAGAGFWGGQQLGVAQGLQERQQAMQQFYGNRSGGQNGQGQTQAAGQNGQGGVAGRGLFGTVSAINGNDITLSARDGTATTVELSADGKVRKQVDGAFSDIHTGDRVTVMGTQNGNVFQATAIQIGGSGRQTQ